MKVSYNWLKEFVDLKKYSAARLADLLTMNFAEVDSIEEIGDDVIFDLKILPDRTADCLSHYGIAREIAALINSKLKIKNSKTKIKESRKEKINDILEVENQEPTICKRYVSRIIENVKVGLSPKWLKQRLEALGQKSINNVVDATNYVMLELGQPLHAFDFDRIKSMQSQISNLKSQNEIQNSRQTSKIIIRKARKGEKIITLDNQEVELSDDILVIASEAKQSVSSSKLQAPSSVLAIAGIKGGEKAKIDENTKNIVLESANFDAKEIRKSSKLIGIKTESSIRFAADLDPNLASLAMERLTLLIANKVAGGEIDIYPRPVKEYRVGFSLEDVNGLLGIELSEKEILDSLKRLNFKIKKVFLQKEILRLAKQLLGARYKYGASVSFDAPDAFDCSSFTSYIFARAGIQIPRISVDQYFYGESVAEKDVKLGDLVFFNSGKGKIYYESQEFMKGLKIKDGIDHVGLYLGGGKIIHATREKGRIVIENLKKIKNSKNFRGFRRVIRGLTLGIQKVEPQEIFVVDVPTYRKDIKFKADIIEEIGRIYGYQNLRSKMPEGVLTPVERNDELHWENMAKNALISAGFAETYNYSFVGSKDLQSVNIDAENNLQLINYPSDDKKYLRPSLIFGLLKNVKDNFRFFKEVRMFELGRVFSTAGEGKYLGGIVSYKSSRGKSAKEFYEIKSAVDLLIRKLGIPEVWYDNYEIKAEFFEKNIYHSLRSAEIKIDNEKIGFVGEINPNVLDVHEIDSRVAVFEIDFNKLAKIAEEDYIYRPISKYPAIERDLAILAPLNIKVDDVLNVLENAGGQLLVDTDLFDIYEGDNIPEGMKSLAFHLVFQSPQKTLSDEEIEKIMSDIFLALGQKGWEVRTS